VLKERRDESWRELPATVSVKRELHHEYKKVSTSLKRKTTSMMMICLCPSGCGKLIVAFWDTVTVIAYDDIVMADIETYEETVREMKIKDGKEAEEPEEEDKEEEKVEKVELSIPTLSEALEAIGIVNRFDEATAGNGKNLSQIVDIEEHLESQYWARRSRHKKGTDFFV
jgi:hypothetical protein